MNMKITMNMNMNMKTNIITRTTARLGFIVALASSSPLLQSMNAERPSLTRRLEQEYHHKALQHIIANSDQLGLHPDDVDGLELTGTAPGSYQRTRNPASAAGASHRGLRGAHPPSQRRRRNTSHLYVAQTFQGITVSNARSTIVMLGDEVKQVNSKFRKQLNRCATLPDDRVITAAQAVEIAATSFRTIAQLDHVTFPVIEKEAAKVDDRTMATVFEGQEGLSSRDIPAHLAYYGMDGKECDVRLAWNIILHIDAANRLEIWVDAGPTQAGVIQHSNWVRSATYSALELPRESPCVECAYGTWIAEFANDIPLDTIVDPELPNASPEGWLTVGSTSYDVTRGNNVNAVIQYKEDKRGRQSTPQTSPGVFDYSGFDFYEAEWESAKNPAAVHLFYVVNRLHDVLYQYGFDESSGNFQEDNYGKGGYGGDSVQAVINYSQTNNAQMYTPPDGERPSLRMSPFDMAMYGTMGIVSRKVWIGSLSFGTQGTDIEFTKHWGALHVWGVRSVDAVLSNTAGNLECEVCDDKSYDRKIVIIRQGNPDQNPDGCDVATKALYAQNRGAFGVIIAAEDETLAELEPSTGLGEEAAPHVTIPVVQLKSSDAMTAIDLAHGGEKASMVSDPTFVHSAFDNGIVAHEWCHGMTNRLLGGSGTSSCTMHTADGNISNGMEEGWSDFCGLFFTQQDPFKISRTIGSFVVLNKDGFRPELYSPDMTVDTARYDERLHSHDIYYNGWVWNSFLWDIYSALVEQEGFNPNVDEPGAGGNNMAMELIVDGLKATPCLPSYTNARDGILDAYRHLYPDGPHYCMLWGVFARRGLGYSATASPIASAFDLPSECSSYTLPQVFWPTEKQCSADVDCMHSEHRGCARSCVEGMCAHEPCLHI